MAAFKYNHSENAARRYKSWGGSSEFGRSSVMIDCPFCETTVRAYVWSLCGGGKKCTGCGAMHTSIGQTWPLFGREDFTRADLKKELS